ncbi:hypothetical protein [Terribacillus sp. DMT04]|uniref:hypothetical protein n=1 Tax=Terribacillus sp. DMT04 TaxID=2850441 RepID=UPI001C2C7E06|nr:hypothetical protein [Terribacillus sp. DMT04]QXE03548.1 hypothetical protein KS242_17895 [Terribacillus sp. DMT04]
MGEKLYILVDLQDLDDRRVCSLEEAKDTLINIWNNSEPDNDEDEAEFENNLKEHIANIKAADAVKLDSYLLGIDHCICSNEEQYLELVTQIQEMHQEGVL